MKKNIITSFALIILYGCGKIQSDKIVAISPNKTMSVSIWGEQSGSLEPWRVYVESTFQNERDTVFTELHADKIDKSNVKIAWTNETTCLVTLTHNDGQTNTVPVIYHTK